MGEMVKFTTDRVGENFVVIAIDGTAASGKTSTSLRLAEKYNLLAVSTGAHYRAITLGLMRAGIGSGDMDGIRNFLAKTTVGSEISKNVACVTISGETFGDKELRAREVNDSVSAYSSVDEVRKFLLPYQRLQVEIARTRGFNGVVMEGRDIASVVLPGADLKIFLEADAGKRFLRREKDNEDDSIGKRDKMDGKRTICGEGVCKIDTVANGLDSVIAIISSKIDEFLLKK
ncbi:MAG: (d)CMP kinase [Puniceicoccales bacterium]|nr:(d)CMP kinase [Puniceicoccales bacterium]